LRRLEILLCCAALLAFVVMAAAEGLKPGAQVTTFRSQIDDTEQPYALYIPRDFDHARRYPLVISLHEGNSSHRLNLRRVFGRGNLAAEAYEHASPRFPRLRDIDYIVASPLARGGMGGYQGVAEREVYDVLDDVERRLPIDQDRVYLTGISAGGAGALWLAATRPDIWAAVAAVCPAPAPEATELAGNLVNVPVHLFHGDADPVVSVELSRLWTAKLAAYGAPVEYAEYRGVRHNSWELAYKDGAVFDWFGQHKRNRFPDRVRYATRSYNYNSAYWVRIDELTPGRLATIDARFVKANRIEAKTSGIGAFTLELKGHPAYSARRPLHITVDGNQVRVRTAATLSFSRRNGGWTSKRYIAPKAAKGRGAEGPISDAMSNRHIYVYGTGGAPGAAEMEQRRGQAARAAAWSAPGSPAPVSFRVLADKDVSESDAESANLILFGGKETNSLIARFSAQLPIELNAGAADYSLTFIYPQGRRYIVINSGLPWWTGAEYSGRTPGLGIPSPYAVAVTFEDFILFKGSLEHVIAEGRFDDQWRVPHATAEKMIATGAVKITN
jgi:poly(3-hydroxybutyrate) depolymerase